MSSLDQFSKQIRSLSYSDMLVVAAEVADYCSIESKNKLDANMVARALVAISIDHLAVSALTKEEEKILSRIFHRKRQLTISKRGNGWELEIPTLQASNVVGTELRPMFPMLLDQIITLHVLNHGSN